MTKENQAPEQLPEAPAPEQLPEAPAPEQPPEAPAPEQLPEAPAPEQPPEAPAPEQLPEASTDKTTEKSKSRNRKSKTESEPNKDGSKAKNTSEESDEKGSGGTRKPTAAEQSAAAATEAAARIDGSGSKNRVINARKGFFNRAVKESGEKAANQSNSEKTLIVLNHGPRSFETYTKTVIEKDARTTVICRHEAEYQAVVSKFNQLNALAGFTRYEILEV